MRLLVASQTNLGSPIVRASWAPLHIVFLVRFIVIGAEDRVHELCTSVASKHHLGLCESVHDADDWGVSV